MSLKSNGMLFGVLAELCQAQDRLLLAKLSLHVCLLYLQFHQFVLLDFGRVGVVRIDFLGMFWKIWFGRFGLVGWVWPYIYTYTVML